MRYIVYLTLMIAENIRHIYDRIQKACHRVGREPESVTLVGVTKTFPASVIREAAAAGLHDFGENYVQEMRQKQAELKDFSIRWHFIGHLQSNKVKSIVDDVHLIHAVDSIELGKEISKRARAVNRHLPVLVEVNTSGETTKFGTQMDEAKILVEQLMVLSHVTVMGLMTIGPFLPDPEASRPAFRCLRSLRDALEREGVKLPALSMGMTNDFEVAIEEGATMIRVGTAIFGHREKKEPLNRSEARIN